MPNDTYTVARERGRPGRLRALLRSRGPSPKRFRGSAFDLASLRRVYALYAPIYDQTFGPAMNRGRKLAVEAANAKAGRVLELGAGTGLSLPDYRADSRIAAVDLSPEMLAKARRLVAAKKLDNVEMIEEMDAAALTFDDDSFDTVVAMYLMPVVPDPARTLAEIERVAKPGADIYIVNHFAGQRTRFALIESILSNFARWIGWNPNFRIETILDNTDLELVSRRPTSAVGLFTLLHMRKSTGAASQQAA